jgi:homoserine O-acetyltransferase/O-succinyltransferase
LDPANPPSRGLSVARQFAMITYRSAKGYQSKFGREKDSTGAWQAKKYLEYQGIKFLDRFDAVTYVKLTEQLDTHDVGRGRGGVPTALGEIKTPVLVMGIDSDILYPLYEQEELAALIPGSHFAVINSSDGHDGFLLEQDQVAQNIAGFLNKTT